MPSGVGGVFIRIENLKFFSLFLNFQFHSFLFLCSRSLFLFILASFLLAFKICQLTPPFLFFCFYSNSRCMHI
ncbi:unnamed protein product [Meloidogyne enterolobii]|uniref:Uncharacterized protein n=1 Tax=Meloidogyne enterolobii TaxID=390850 RepID=A0ACB0YV99_MELEN